MLTPITDFSQTIIAWQTFYLLTGTAAATLIGLLFVAVSINLKVLRGNSSGSLYSFAALTFNRFFYVLLISILFLIPHLSPLELGIPLLLVGGLGLANVILQQRRIRRLQGNQRETDIATRFNVHIGSLAGLALIAIGVMLKFELSLYGLVLVPGAAGFGCPKCMGIVGTEKIIPLLLPGS